MNVAFIGTGTMGYDGNILYWKSIITKVCESFPKTTVFLSHSVNAGNDSKILTDRFRSFSVFGRKIWLPDFFKKLRIINPDVIIVSEFGIVVVFAIIFSFIYKSKVVLLVENHPKFLSNYGIKRIGFFSAFRGLIAYLSDVTVANNLSVREYLKNDLLVNDKKIVSGVYLTSVLNCVNNKNKSNGGKIVFVAVGQLIKRKGIDKFIREVFELNKKHPEMFEVKIVGDGPLASQIRLLIQEYELDQVVDLVGKVQYEKMGEFLGGCDVFVMPTLADFRSLVMLEAISVGLPVIGSCYDGASQEVIVCGENGYICDPLIEGDIMSSMSWFIENRDKLESFSRSSLTISTKFTVDIAAETICKAINLAMVRRDG